MVAYQAARDIYGGGVEVEVVLQDGSLFTKITVVGGLLLGTYHGVASYPDFKDGIVELCEDANKYTDAFVHNFLSASATPQSKVVKISTSTKTPGKVSRLLKKLERLDQKAKQKTEISEQLATANQTLESIARDISKVEIENLKTQLEFNHLPPVKRWPLKPSKTKKQLKAPALQKHFLKAAPARKKRLLYHNIFTVPPTK